MKNDSNEERLNTTRQTAESEKEVRKAIGAKASKFAPAYWQSRVFRPRYPAPDGTSAEAGAYYAQMQHAGRREKVGLGTNDRQEASRRAARLYSTIVSEGWADGLSKVLPGRAEKQRTFAPAGKLTLGEFIRHVEGLGMISPVTFKTYAGCLHTITSEALGIKGGREKFDHRSGGNEKWCAKVDAVLLSEMTPERVEEWMRQRLAKAGRSPGAVASAKRSANSNVRCARAMFSKKIRKALDRAGVELPTPLPFQDVELFDAGSMKYVSKVNVRALIMAAREELRTNHPESYAAFVLALFVGLRRGEIDNLEWRMIDFDAGVIRLIETEFMHLKTDGSSAVVPLDPEVLQELRGLKQRGKGPFVIHCTRPPKAGLDWDYLRCKPIFEHLSAWLRSKGITSNKPLHEMRKELGAQIATKHGIYAASVYLRHADITTTARHYAAHKGRISAGLGEMLSEPQVAVLPAASTLD